LKLKSIKSLRYVVLKYEILRAEAAPISKLPRNMQSTNSGMPVVNPYGTDMETYIKAQEQFQFGVTPMERRD